LVNKTVYAFIDVINPKTGGFLPVLEKARQKTVGITTLWFDITKAKKALGWTPKVTLEDSIEEGIAVGDLKQ
jgi:nucleoside-diphosphate-sugar epimerase